MINLHGVDNFGDFAPFLPDLSILYIKPLGKVITPNQCIIIIYNINI